MRSFKLSLWAILFCGIGLHSAQAQGAMVEVVPVRMSVGYLAGGSFSHKIRGPRGHVLTTARIAFKAAAAKRLSKKIYFGCQLELGGEALYGFGYVLFLFGPFVNYYPWGQGQFISWGDKLYFVGAFNLKTFGLYASLNPYIGVGYDLRMGKRRSFAITPELAYDFWHTVKEGYLHAVVFNIRWRLFTGKARLPKFPAK